MSDTWMELRTDPKFTGNPKFWRHVEFDPNSGCWLWAGASGRHGYGNYTPKKFCSARAHRYSFENHYGPVPEGKIVRHTCDTPLCVNPAHLLLGTVVDNMKDMSSRGRAKTGAGYRRTDEKRISDVKVLLHFPIRAVAREIGVAPSTVRRIKLRLESERSAPTSDKPLAADPPSQPMALER